MMSLDFLEKRLTHLRNKLRAVKKSLEDYGSSMPQKHSLYKIKEMLPAIEKAIAKIEENPHFYGICENCNDEIPEKRLEIFPEATSCIHCQNKKEVVYNALL